MNKDALTKLHSKFANERHCKNERCGGYFLSKEPQDYCPLCREKGFGSEDVKENKDLLFREVNVTKLQAQVDDINSRLKLIEERLNKKRTFAAKKCAACGKEFIPASPNQQICNKCREEITK